MNRDDYKLKECVVLLEPCTPKAQTSLSAELRKVIDERNILTSHTRRKFISALEEINATDADVKRANQKQKVVQEILDSEMVYLRQLEIIKQYFMAPMRSKNIIAEIHFESIFGCLETIYKVNGELLNALKADLINVTAAFSKLAPFFKLYSVYAYDFKKSLKTLQDLHDKHGKFSAFVSCQESRPEVQSKLSYLLITPIQRIPRYCMLLKQVLEYTLPTDDDYIKLKATLDDLEKVARHVDALVEEREHSQKLLELQRRVRNGRNLIIYPGRKLIKEGPLTEQTEKGTQKMHLILMSDVLLVCKIKRNNLSQADALKCTLILPLNKCKVEQNSNTKMFEVTCMDNKVVLYHEQGTEGDEWVKIINKAIDKYVRNRTTLRKGSSSRRPVGKDNFGPYLDVGVSPGISRIRKRRWTDDEVEPIASSEQNAKLEIATASETSRVSKRRAIHETNKDILYPLREQVGLTSETETKPDERTTSNEVFVFGVQNTNRGFGFKLGNLFTGIGNSFKKVFGFK